MIDNSSLVRELKYIKRKYIAIEPIKCKDGDIILGIYLPSVVTSPDQTGMGVSLLKVKDMDDDEDYYNVGESNKRAKLVSP